MLKRTLLTTAAGILGLFASINHPAGAQNRLPQAIPTASARVSLAHTVSEKARLSSDLGLANPDQALSLSLRFSMTPTQKIALEQLLASQQNPSSPQYHHWLTPRQFGTEFGLSTSDLSSVKSWLQSQGFTVTGVANGRTFVEFTGSVAQANQAFGVSLHSLRSDGEHHISNLTDPTLPAVLAQVTSGITGLNDFKAKPRIHQRVITASADLATAKYNGSTLGQGNLLAPGDFYTIYDENKLITPSTGSAINGAGVTIGVLGEVQISTSDVSAFRTASGLSSNPPTQVVEGTLPAAPSAAYCNSNPSDSSCLDLEESSLDLEWAGASAPGANILFVTGPDIFLNSMTQAIDQNLAPILTVSYGLCEAYFGSPSPQALDTLFMQANAQGQTVLGPAGDAGATDCDGGSGQTYAQQGLAVDYPASSPYVTAVGGTQFNEGGGTYWNSTVGTNGGSALGYIPEQPWNEFFYTVANSASPEGLNYGAGGGGVSSLYPKPYWQQGAGVPADASRDVPDVAFAAGANHDGYLYCVFSSCTNGGFSSTSAGNTYYYIAGGTSFATPIFAGTLALVEQKTGARIGNANPSIYGLANSQYLNTVFHDKTSGGTNAAPCSPGTIDCSTGFPDYYAAGTLACPSSSCSGNVGYPTIGYIAGSGYTYDTATGWGSVDIANFVNDWTLATPIAATSTSTQLASLVTVATTTPSISSGATLSVTATVASATTATTVPTGTVTLLVDNVAEGTPATLSGGSATLTYMTPATFASGTHTVSVSYSGDSIYAGSKGATSVNVTSASLEDFSFTPAVTNISVPLGGTSTPIQFTVSSLNGFVGAVSFTATTSSTVLSNDANVNFSVTSASVSATAPGTTALTIYAYYNSTTGYHKGANLKRVADLSPAKTANPWALGGSGVALAGLLLFGLPAKRRNRWSALLVVVFTMGLLSIVGCSGNAGTANNNGNVDAPAGTYPITVTASGTSTTGVAISHSATVNLTIQ